VARRMESKTLKSIGKNWLGEIGAALFRPVRFLGVWDGNWGLGWNLEFGGW